MKNDNVCPGCHKHCPLSQPRCKYGLAYAARQAQKAAAPKHKWQRFAQPDGLAWTLFTTSKRAKKALCHARATEDQLFGDFTIQEKETFRQLLAKIRLENDE